MYTFKNPGQTRSHQDPKLQFILYFIWCLKLYQLPFLVAARKIFCWGDVSVLVVDVDFCVFLGPCSGRAACCIMSGHRRPPGGNKSSTCNSEQSRLASVSTSIRSGLSVSPPTKMEAVMISPAKECWFITVIIPKPRFDRNLPCCTTVITFHIIKMTNRMEGILFSNYQLAIKHTCLFQVNGT